MMSIERIIKRVEQGHKKYLREAELEKLLDDLQKEYLSIAVAQLRPRTETISFFCTLSWLRDLAILDGRK